MSAEKEQSLKPSTLQDFMKLPNEIQCEVIQLCDYETRLNLSETCSHLNKLLFSTPKTAARIWLKLSCYNGEDEEKDYCQNFNEKLEMLSSNGRKYTNLWLYKADDALNSKSRNNLLRTLEIIGSNVKQLEILCGTYQVNDFAFLLHRFGKVEKIKVRNVDSFEGDLSFNEGSNNSIITTLKEVDFDRTSALFLRAFDKITKVDTLKLSLYSENLMSGNSEIEDFLLGLQELKCLQFYLMSDENLNYNYYLFQHKSTKNIKFRLKSMTGDLFVHKNNALKFLDTQLPSLQSLSMNMCWNPRMTGCSNEETLLEYVKIINSILKSTTLKKLSLFGSFNEFVELLGSEMNSSVERLSFGRIGGQHEMFIKLFTNLKSVDFQSSDDSLNVATLSKETFAIMNQSKNFCAIRYHPESTDNLDSESCEKYVLQCLNRFKPKYYNSLRIGKREWIGTDFSFSMTFWETLIKTISFKHIIVFNPRNTRALITFFRANSDKAFSLTIVTDQETKNSVQDLLTNCSRTGEVYIHVTFYEL